MGDLLLATKFVFVILLKCNFVLQIRNPRVPLDCQLIVFFMIWQQRVVFNMRRAPHAFINFIFLL